MAKPILSELVDDGALYVAERKIYPRETSGTYQRLRVLAVVVLLGMYYLFPWLSWAGRQAVLFDLPARKFYIFGLAFWPQDFFFLALLLIIAGMALFFFTALAGRLWCGYACPQTVWTEVFLWMEQWAEGDRSQRIKLDAAPWSANKLRRKLAKHSLWLGFALWTGFTFVGFFTPIRDLGARLWPFGWSGWESFWVLFYGLATWGNAGVLREQVCKYMCPYARFQSAMFDRNTLIISYDPMRGEPRGARKRNSLASVLERARGLLPIDQATAAVVHAAHRSGSAGARVSTGLVVDIHRDDALPPALLKSEDLGDCIDCTICVQVCPTGIDIRNGLQYECIACAACVDACDAVMGKMGYPRGLIRHTTQNAIDGKPTRVLRARVWIYGLLLLALVAGTVTGIAQRKPLLVDVMRDKQLYRIAADGRIENTYTLRIINKQSLPKTFLLNIESAAPVQLDAASNTLVVAAEEVLTVPVTISAESGAIAGRADIRFVVRDRDSSLRQEEVSRFFGPSSP